MSNLPEQAHQQSTAVAVRPEDNPYALDQSMVTLPRLRIAQYQSKAFKRKLVEYGDLYVGIGQEDQNPVVVAKQADPLGEALVFYVHRIERGFNYAEDPTDLKNLTFGPLGGTFAEALTHTGGDPRRVFQKIDYTLTVPAFAALPVKFLMTGRWGGNASRWMNTQIGILLQEGKRPLEQPFIIQTRQTHNDKGDFTEAVVGFGDVKGKEIAAHTELVEKHAALLAVTSVVSDDYADDIAPADVVNAPSLS